MFLRPSNATLLPLHSPRPHVPMHTFFSEGARSVPIVVVDYSGRNVSVFPLGSSPTVASHPDLLCPNATGAEGPFTISGCGGSTAFSAISFYAGTALMMRTDNKIIVKPKPKFYYSFALVVQAQSSQGNASFGYTVFQFCAEFKFDTVVGLMPPDWAVVTNGSIARKQPPLQLRCLYLNLCFVDVCAAHFALDLQQQPQVSGRATFIDILTSSTDEKFSDAALQQQPAPFGVTCGRHFFGPSQGNFTRTFVSKIYTVCVQARSTGVVSPSNPICISAKVRCAALCAASTACLFEPTTAQISSRPPRSAGSLALVPPRPIGIPPSATPAVLVVSPGDLIPSQVVCLDTPINIVFSGFDDDETEGSEVFLKDATVGTSSVFAPPLNGLQSKYYDALSRVSQTMLSLLVGKNNGFTRDDYGLPLPPRSRRLCVFMVDDTFSRYGRYGDWPHTGYASELNCFSLTFQGPPEFLGVFVGQPGDMEWPLLDSPAFEFNLLSQNGAVSPVLNLGLGRSIVISFMAADCNPFDVISFLVREDPGLPSANVTVFPVRCIPRKVFDSEFPGGVAVAPCSLAVASVGWTVLLDQLPPSASSGQFSVPLCFIARDSSTSCTGTSPSAAATGWYSAPACAQLHVVLPALSWIASAMEHLPPYPVISVGFDCSYRLTAVLINTAAVITDVPVNVSLTGNATQLLVGNVQVVAQLVQQQQQWHVAALFRFSAAHQGLRFTACFDATCTGLPSVQQRVCTVMVVQVCSVCTHAQSSLYAMAVHYYSSSDWQPLLQLNLECSSDRLCISQQSVLPLSSDFTFSSDRGVVIPCLRIGTVVAAQAGDTAAALATAWNTSVSLVQRLNPSRVAGAQGDWCIPKDARED